MTDDQKAKAVLDITRLLCVALERRRAYWPDYQEVIRKTRAICEGCGCLCWPDEKCPGCRARRMEREVA